MDFKTFTETVLGNQVNIGDEVWICDYRHNDIAEKPIRHVVPQKVRIVDNADLPTNKKVYYSAIHFVPLSKNGTPKKQIIAPFDNTGFRFRTGDAVHVFEDEKECRDFYVTQCEVVKTQIEEARRTYERMFNNMTDSVNQKISENKI